MYSYIKMGIFCFGISLTTGCAYVATPYGISGENVNTLKGIGDVQVKLNEFTATDPGKNSIGCRAAGPVETPNKESFEKYIEGAFKSELSIAGLYNESSPIVLSGNLKNANFSSNIGTGNWVFTLETVSSNSKSIVVDSKYEFSSNFVADKACQQVAQALSPAVQKLIHDVISHPEFSSLLKNTETARK